MFSPGKFHLKVPREPAENLRFRKWILQKAAGDRRIQRGLIEACRQDILFYINVFVWQVNQRHKKGKPEIGPFITWDFQDEAVRIILQHIEDDVDLLIEKSREMGASWLNLIIMDWFSLFHQWKKFLCISHSEAAVDRAEDPDSLFWKVNFMHENLPGWLRRNQGVKRKLGFAFPDTKSSINGAASTGRSGVGGRATAVFLDEFSKQVDDFAILGQTADTGCRIFNGTHYGIGSAFHELTRRPDLHKLVMHWSQHPDKNKGLYRFNKETRQIDVLDTTYQYPPDFKFVMDGEPLGGPFPGLRSPWYDKECIRRNNKRDVAMHLDINPEGSTSQFFDQGQIHELIRLYCREPLWEGELEYDRDTGKPNRLVPIKGGSIRLWCNMDANGKPPRGSYGGGADISAGTGATPSCLTFTNRSTGEKVLEYSNPFVDPKEFAVLAVALCWLFQDGEGQGAVLAWEMQGPGITFGQKILALGYRNIYWRKNENLLGQPYTATPTPGWVPNGSNIRVLMEEYRSALVHKEMLNRSERALKECLAFVYTKTGGVEHGGSTRTNDPSGARESHGDYVVADALSWKMCKGGAVTRTEDKSEEPEAGSLAWRRDFRHNTRRLQESEV